MKNTIPFMLALGLGVVGCSYDNPGSALDAGAGPPDASDLGRSEQGLSLAIAREREESPFERCVGICDGELEECFEELDRVPWRDWSRQRFAESVCNMQHSSCLQECDRLYPP